MFFLRTEKNKRVQIYKKMDRRTGRGFGGSSIGEWNNSSKLWCR